MLALAGESNLRFHLDHRHCGCTLGGGSNHQQPFVKRNIGHSAGRIKGDFISRQETIGTCPYD